MIALNRQGTQQQRPRQPTVTPPGMRVNTGYIYSNKGTSSKVKQIAHWEENAHTHTHTHTHTHKSEREGKKNRERKNEKKREKW